MSPLALFLALAQSPPAGPQAAPAGPSNAPAASSSNASARANGASSASDLGMVDQVVQIVNEDMMTQRKFVTAMRMQNRGKPPQSLEERARLEQEVHEISVKAALRVQAGQDMGLDPAQVDRNARSYIEDQRAHFGQEKFAELLQQSGMTLYEYQEWIRDRLYSTFWENYVTGTGSQGQGSRPSRDRYVRPGSMQYRYEQVVENPELLHQIGGHDQSVIVQQLILDPKSLPQLGVDPKSPPASGLEAARAIAEDLRRRILGGEDMTALVDLYGASKTNHGISEPAFVESRLSKIDPTLGAFVAQSKPGDVSEVQEFKIRDHELVRIVRFVDRLPMVVPQLNSLDVQKMLEKGMRTEMAEWRKEQAYNVLFNSSYVWPAKYEAPPR
jgi:hypothetical protein